MARRLDIPGLLVPMVSAALLVAALLVGGLQAREVEGTDAFHERVRRAVQDIPMKIGAWTGRDVEPMPSAIDLLDPVVILQRRYVHPQTQDAVSLLIVYCKDVRRLFGHYPPNCYPSAGGWSLSQIEDTEVPLLGGMQPAVEYAFRRDSAGIARDLSVLNFMVSPSRTRPIVRGMDELMASSPSRLTPGLGAGQVQILGLDKLDAPLREQTRNEFLRAIEPAVRVIAEGVSS